MARRLEAEISNIRDEWRRKIFQPEFRELSFTAQGKELGVSAVTISNWRKEIGANRWQEILDMTRKEAALPTLEVDDALLRAAKGGDVAACKLWYEIHGWSPKQNLEVSRGPDVELSPEAVFGVVKDAMKLLTPEQKAELLGQGGSQAVLEAPVVVEGGSEIRTNVEDVAKGGEAKGI